MVQKIKVIFVKDGDYSPIDARQWKRIQRQLSRYKLDETTPQHGLLLIEIDVQERKPTPFELLKIAVRERPDTTNLNKFMTSREYLRYLACVNTKQKSVITGSLNDLARSGYTTFSQIREQTFNTLLAVRNMGQTKAKLIVEIFDLK